jgi:hypothetical protein
MDPQTKLIIDVLVAVVGAAGLFTCGVVLGMGIGRNS